jgi:hypothetical protein
MQVTSGFLRVLGVQLAAGRNFVPNEDDRVSDAVRRAARVDP